MKHIILLFLLTFVVSEDIKLKEGTFLSYVSTFLSEDEFLKEAESVVASLQNGEFSEALDTTVHIVEDVVLTTMLEEEEPTLGFKNPFNKLKEKLKKIKELLKRPDIRGMLENTLRDVIQKGLARIPYATEVCSFYCSVDKGVHPVCNYC